MEKLDINVIDIFYKELNDKGLLYDYTRRYDSEKLFSTKFSNKFIQAPTHSTNPELTDTTSVYQFSTVIEINNLVIDVWVTHIENNQYKLSIEVKSPDNFMKNHSSESVQRFHFSNVISTFVKYANTVVDLYDRKNKLDVTKHSNWFNWNTIYGLNDIFLNEIFNPKIIVTCPIHNKITKRQVSGLMYIVEDEIFCNECGKFEEEQIIEEKDCSINIEQIEKELDDISDDVIKLTETMSKSCSSWEMSIQEELCNQNDSERQKSIDLYNDVNEIINQLEKEVNLSEPEFFKLVSILQFLSVYGYNSLPDDEFLNSFKEVHIKVTENILNPMSKEEISVCHAFRATVRSMLIEYTEQNINSLGILEEPNDIKLIKATLWLLNKAIDDSKKK